MKPSLPHSLTPSGRAIAAGMAAAARRGVRLGRPSNAARRAAVAKLVGKATAPEISRQLRIPQSTVYSIINQLKK